MLAAGALAALPVLLAFLPLAAGRYLGSETLDRIIDRRGTGARRQPAASITPPRSPLAASLPRGGRLIASSLAKRPPPRAIATA